MGGRGAGDFDEDTAADHLSLSTGRLVPEVAEAMTGDPVGGPTSTGAWPCRATWGCRT